MVSRTFSTQKGAQRQRSLTQFKHAMSMCGEDLPGILKTRYGKNLKAQLPTGDNNNKEQTPSVPPEILGSSLFSLPTHEQENNTPFDKRVVEALPKNDG